MKRTIILGADFETTGLDLVTDQILEGYFEALLMDPDNGVSYKTLFEGEFLVDSEYDRSTLHPIVEEMHTKSGLWDDLAANADNLFKISTVDSIVSAAIGKLREEYPDTSIHLAGMGVGAYDRRMIERDMPVLNSMLHYRPADVSVARTVLQLDGWEIPADGKDIFSASTHRAKDDVKQGIAQTKYLTELMKRIPA